MEIFHSMQRKSGKSGLMAIKLDMAHAYDRLEWKFLLQVLKCFSFNSLWRQLIHQCISTVTFSILLNGSPHGCFQPSRGLRQGDPLSPFLFILASEVLSRLFYLEVRFGSLHGIIAVRRAPPVTHLLFAGDLFIFCRANIRETREVDDILSFIITGRVSLSIGRNPLSSSVLTHIRRLSQHCVMNFVFNLCPIPASTSGCLCSGDGRSASILLLSKKELGLNWLVGRLSLSLRRAEIP
ncbi:hypothetical protein CJ030_MR5G008784 [Morella rubra]|uniref:Reverse transcriptase domain-containing protein n=1 Tax=Morella rubra TaxID=262757 RepID=A0A6A1WWW6_9ROSI|nr:hypothetical protein CJ030_MR5G008784 [Morella rubra]